MKFAFKIIVISVFVSLLFSTTTSNAYATLLSCTASSSPSSAQPSTTNNRIDFTVNNTDWGNSIVWFSITRPFSGITFEVLSLPGWSKTNTGESVVFTGGSVSPYTSTSPYLTVGTDATGGSGDWIIKASDSSDGSNPTTCTVDGSLAFEVSSSGLDVTPPVISSLSVSGVSSSQVTVSWTTDEASDTLVQYGVEPSSYPFNSSDTADITSHSRTLTNLGSNTTYYYIACSTDAAGNQTCSDESNFTTAAASTATTAPTTAATATPTPTATSTTAATTAATATPTPFVDRSSPSVNVTTDLDSSFEEAPLIEGTATDNIRIDSVDFSTDGGANWLPISDVEGLSTSEVEWSFTPQLFEDGNYEVQIRAVDSSGNTGLSDTITVIIDRLPPRVGGNLVSLGPLPLHPNEDGVIITIPGLAQRITMSAVGGPTSVDLLVNQSVASLAFSPQTNLWTGALNLVDAGTYQLRTRAIDGAGNKTERDLNTIVVLDPGEIEELRSSSLVDEGEITIYIRDPLTKLWSQWDAETFGQSNPQSLSEGTYQFYLPPGTYYLTIEAPGNPKLTSKIFKVEEATPLTADFKMMPRGSFNIGPIRIPLPSAFSEKADVVFKIPDTKKLAVNTQIGQRIKNFILPSTQGEFNSSSLIGDRAVISFINTWSPPAVEQLPILDNFYDENRVSHAIVASQESISRVTVFQQRGRYTTEIVIDRDGELVEEYGLTSLPMHFFLNRRGEIQNVVTGVLNKEELQGFLNEI